MKVKAIFQTILFLAFSIVAFGQEYKKAIEQQFLDYNNLIINKEFEKSMTFVPDEVFEIIPREQMIIVMEKTFNNPGFEFELKTPKIKEISRARKIDGKFYSFLTYSSLIEMKFLNDEQEEETENEQKLRVNMIKLSLEESFGSENVKYDEVEDVFEVNAQKQAYAISNNGKEDWKFLVIDTKQKFLLDKLLPKKLADKINNS
jgi:hypothetical protein